MNRIKGLEKRAAPWHLRWFYTTMRKMFGKDLTQVTELYKPEELNLKHSAPTS